ncbi:MAG: hypothetical protein MRJ68_11500 [Nitrospira sp.]|nr:hypothetical protein [Nitrospira sp.]
MRRCIEDEALRELVRAEGHDHRVECGKQIRLFPSRILRRSLTRTYVNTSLALPSLNMARLTMIPIGKNSKVTIFRTLYKT